jgi:hypothetical protein
MQVREEVSKKERSDRENTRARKKPGTPFPEDCSQIIAALQKAGFAESLIIEQIDMMRDWALAGDNRKVDWVAFARNWLRKNNKPAQFGFNNATAKPLTFHQATQVHNARIIRETLFGTDQAEPQRPALGRSII